MENNKPFKSFNRLFLYHLTITILVYGIIVPSFLCLIYKLNVIIGLTGKDREYEGTTKSSWKVELEAGFMLMQKGLSGVHA